MDQFWLAFIPLFVALDGLGLSPIFLGLVRRLPPAQRRQAALGAALTALAVCAGFLALGRAVFTLMGLELADIMVAGGAILLVLSLRELVLSEKPPEGSYANPSVVPLGVPLLAGPAALTTVLLVRDRYGLHVTLLALLANAVVAWGILRSSEWVMARLGEAGAQIVSKISNLVLTAFGVMLVRHGVTMMIAIGSLGP